MEDVRLGRELASSADLVVLAADTDTQVVGPLAGRTRIVFEAPGGTSIYIGPVGLQLAAGLGVILSAGQPFRVFDIETYGPIVEGPWHALSPGVQSGLTIFQSTLYRK